jgi:tRNA-uridine 2-sulfurtransferase
MAKKELKKKVFVGLSGGVDSSVSAALLKEAGFEVYGVFIKVWQPDIAITGGCTWKQDRLDAMRVCAKLDIPFYTLNLEKEYKKEVVDYMIAEYKAGRTPNPDVMCNKYVKFGGFFDWAMKNGADFVATGHYAQVKTNQKKIGQTVELLAGKDKNKDQSYFLWTLTQKQLSKTLFPVGNIEKPQVRKLAKKFGLLTAEKKDSQGVCFIGKIEMIDFLKEFIKIKKGNVLNEKGEIIGSHDGIFYYTIGQRHGFNIIKKTTDEGRYFIVSKDFKNNTLTVSHNPINTETISSKEIELRDINWISGKEPDFKKDYSARIRYRQPLEKCQLKYQGSTLMVVFQKTQTSPTPGQSVVIYNEEVCLGGGIIE